jgi:hypothetical protein
MELAPVAILTVLVAIAGPIGVTLGWWLGRRGERERQGREERKTAYLAFVRASIRFRNATDGERQSVRDERWAALAEIFLVAPPAIVRAAAYMVSTGERLLDDALGPDQRMAVYQEMWDNNSRFTRLARSDLGISVADPFEGYQPVAGERIVFDHPPEPHEDVEVDRSASRS